MTALFLQGNARDVLRSIPSDWFHCVVTSPPYFGLRRYDGGEEIWDGDGECGHEWVDTPPRRSRKASDIVNLGSKEATNRGNLGIELLPTNTCAKCGAWKGQLGAEPTPDLYISHLVQVCQEVKRVLRPDGVFWLNIGDSWAGSWGNYGARSGKQRPLSENRFVRKAYEDYISRPATSFSLDGTKPLDMVLIPSLLALALREDGWYVRSQVVWSKNNPMPESVNGWRWERHKVKIANGAVRTQKYGEAGLGFRDHSGYEIKGAAEWQDCPGCPKCSPHDGYVLRKGSWRPTDSYEIILMLTRTGNYFCDREAVLERIADSTVNRGKVDFGGAKGRCYSPDKTDPNYRAGNEQWGRTYDYRESNGNGGRNLRSVWEFPTKPYSGAHFAVFPPRLPELCIKSSTSERGCCPECGAPWARIVDKRRLSRPELPKDDVRYRPNVYSGAYGDINGHADAGYTESSTIGWMSSCSCPQSDPTPCRVLDPFSGAGTTALVCEQLGIDSISVDTSPEYITLAEARIVDDEQKRIDEQIKQLRREAKLASKNG